MTPTSLPIELVREIISQVLYQNLPEKVQVGTTSKPSWSLISSLVVASKTFRMLVLELWFRRLFVKRPGDLLDGGLMFKEIKTLWTRELHCVHLFPLPPTSSLPIWRIQDFRMLTALRFDWVMSIPDDQSFLINGFRKQPTLTELDVRGMEWPSPNVMASISSLFPALEVLRLNQGSVWCGLCHLCCTPSFQNTFPSGLRYTGGMGLPFHYAIALAPLIHLKEVHISVGCGTLGNTALGTGSQENENFWSGECDKCMVSLYTDEQFRSNLIAKKKDQHKRPPLLEKVEWRFQHQDGNQG